MATAMFAAWSALASRRDTSSSVMNSFDMVSDNPSRRSSSCRNKTFVVQLLGCCYWAVLLLLLTY